MTGLSVELWLVLQILFDVILCVLMMYYFFGSKNLRRKTMLEKEKMMTAVDSLHRLIKQSEELDEKHQKVLEIWRKIEGKGAVLENRLDCCKEAFEEMDASVNDYENISRLVEKGFSANDISHKLGLPRGEVELVMNLKRQ